MRPTTGVVILYPLHEEQEVQLPLQEGQPGRLLLSQEPATHPDVRAHVRLIIRGDRITRRILQEREVPVGLRDQEVLVLQDLAHEE